MSVESNKKLIVILQRVHVPKTKHEIRLNCQKAFKFLQNAEAECGRTIFCGCYSEHSVFDYQCCLCWGDFSWGFPSVSSKFVSVLNF